MHCCQFQYVLNVFEANEMKICQKKFYNVYIVYLILPRQHTCDKVEMGFSVIFFHFTEVLGRKINLLEMIVLGF